MFSLRDLQYNKTEIMFSEDFVLLQKAREKFISRYERSPICASRAPGRVNLIGDHVDYCDGVVLPMAVQFSTIAVGARNCSDKISITSLSDGKELVAEFHTHTKASPLTPGEPSWANYVKGVIAHFPGEVQGFDAVITSNIPVGGGLSSSAALEVAMFILIEAITEITVEPMKKILLCQKAEHTFAGMPCGVMDQYASVMGKEDHALLLDCKLLESTFIPIVTTDLVFLITNSNVKHSLSGSEYPQRRAQCEQALKLLGRRSMRDVCLEDLNRLRSMNADEIIIKRAQHVITETARAKEAARCMTDGDYERVGELFYESHESLKNLMEVSCPEIDELIEINKSVKAVLGARMTGGGFGGCTISIIPEPKVQRLIDAITKNYSGTPHFLICIPKNGAARINVN